ncbi:MAG: ATP-binding protein [Thermodesulfobacteriota bacterium]
MAFPRFLRSLSHKILAAVFAGILVIMGVEIAVRLSLGIRDRIEQMEVMAVDLAGAAYAGIRYPMSMGDSEAVKRVLADIRWRLTDTEVFICDPDQVIVWSTHPDWVQERIAAVIASPAILAGLGEALQSGSVLARSSYEERRADGRYLVTIEPIANEPECVHCHGASRAIVGGMVIRANMERPLAAITRATHSSIAIISLGIGATMLLIYALVQRFITLPVARLSRAVARVAAGDLEAAIEPVSGDEIGELGRSFNRMTRDLRQARQEISVWTRNLEELVEERTSQLRRAMDGAIQAEKMASLGRLAAIVAHEINNPLAGIRTYAKLLLKQEGAADGGGDPRRLQYLATIESESGRCGEIVRNLLQFSRPDQPQLDRHDLNPVIQECVQLVRHKIELQGIEAQLHLAPEPLVVSCDRQKIKQALVALLLNACDAVPPGSGQLDLGSLPEPERRGATVFVRDNGTGMSEETRAHIFEPFFTTKVPAPSGPGAGANVGLGLTVVYEIVKAHRGEILVDSREGQGTTVTIFLPEEPRR